MPKHLFRNCKSSPVQNLSSIVGLIPQEELEALKRRPGSAQGRSGNAMFNVAFKPRLNKNEEEKAVSYVAMAANQYIHTSNWKGDNLSLAELKGRIRGVEYIERQIAIKKAKTDKHDARWSDILELIA